MINYIKPTKAYAPAYFYGEVDVYEYTTPPNKIYPLKEVYGKDISIVNSQQIRVSRKMKILVKFSMLTLMTAEGYRLSTHIYRNGISVSRNLYNSGTHDPTIMEVVLEVTPDDVITFGTVHDGPPSGAVVTWGHWHSFIMIDEVEYV